MVGMPGDAKDVPCTREEDGDPGSPAVTLASAVSTEKS